MTPRWYRDAGLGEGDVSRQEGYFFASGPCRPAPWLHVLALRRLLALLGLCRPWLARRPAAQAGPAPAADPAPALTRHLRLARLHGHHRLRRLRPSPRRLLRLTPLRAVLAAPSCAVRLAALQLVNQEEAAREVPPVSGCVASYAPAAPTAARAAAG